MATKNISYLECVRRVMGEKFILCNNVVQDDVFMEQVYSYYYNKVESQTRKDLSKLDTFEEVQDYVDYEDISVDVDWYKDRDDLQGLKNDIVDCVLATFEIPDVYQYYITGANEYDVEYNDTKLNGALDLVYNDELELYILCVRHFGTAWSGVYGTEITE